MIVESTRIQQKSERLLSECQLVEMAIPEMIDSFLTRDEKLIRNPSNGIQRKIVAIVT